jgi:hypothetical protein
MEHGLVGLASVLVIKRTRLTEELDFAAYRKRSGESALQLFVIRESGDCRNRHRREAACTQTWSDPRQSGGPLSGSRQRIATTIAYLDGG